MCASPVTPAVVRETEKMSFPGLPMAGLAIALLLIVSWSGFQMGANKEMTYAWNLPLILPAISILAGLYMLQPKEAAILTFFGRYGGTDRGEGLRWANPFYMKRRISLRARNLNVPTLKVNDQRGNPIEIGAVVVWSVQDTAKAVFEVDSFERYVEVQAEAALRHLASVYPYDEGEASATPVTTLRGGLDEVSEALRKELQVRFERAGIDVLDAKLTHLAYARRLPK